MWDCKRYMSLVFVLPTSEAGQLDLFTSCDSASTNSSNIQLLWVLEKRQQISALASLQYITSVYCVKKGKREGYDYCQRGLKVISCGLLEGCKVLAFVLTYTKDVFQIQMWLSPSASLKIPPRLWLWGKTAHCHRNICVTGIYTQCICVSGDNLIVVWCGCSHAPCCLDMTAIVHSTALHCQK